jgi:Lar family restriction alleviation protein
MSTEELECCPFCGGGAGIQNGPPHLWYVECYDCMVNGSIERSEVAAVAAWNKRAAPAAGTVEKDADFELVREALDIAHDLAIAEAEHVHETYKGYKPHRHEAVDRDVETVKRAIAAIEAHNAQKEQP